MPVLFQSKADDRFLFNKLIIAEIKNMKAPNKEINIKSKNKSKNPK